MELRVLGYFLAVAREENFTRAAEQLHVTQPTLSRQIADLEAELGVKLFVRSNHNIVLTEDGMLLKRRAQGKYQQQIPFPEAVEKAIDECIKKGILAEFLRKNRAEVLRVSIFEYDEEKHMRMEREESRENGIAIGIVKTAQKYHAEKEQIINQISDELNVSHQEAETIYSEVEEYIKTSQEEK